MILFDRWFLWTTLGSTNFILPEGHKVAYKTEYEFMKIQGTTVHLALSCVQLFVDWTLLDSLSNFLLLYLYSTMTVREHLLLANGSHIRFWWIAHHYLFIGISATILIWPAGPSYESMRSVLISISVIIGAVQLLQYRYQLKRLYTLRALSKVDNMEVTTDAEHLHLTTGLFFLLPFLFLGHVPVFMFYNMFASVCFLVSPILCELSFFCFSRQNGICRVASLDAGLSFPLSCFWQRYHNPLDCLLQIRRWNHCKVETTII